MDECKEPGKEPGNNLKDAVMAHREMVGLSWDDIKKGLDRIVPVLETITKMTENPYDDLAIDFIKKLMVQ